MNPLTKLFTKTPTAQDIRMQLKELERDQRKKRRDLEGIEQTKQQKVKEAVAAKKAGKQELLRDVYREMTQIEIDSGYIHNDLRRISLAKTALTSFLRRMEMLNQEKDRKSLQNLIVRFRDSSLQKTIDTAEVDDDSFNDLLQEILGEEEGAVTQGKVKEDDGFAEFDRAIEEMAKVPDSDAGDEELARLRDLIDKPKTKAPDNYPSYGDKAKGKSPDNYPSYGNKPAARDLTDESVNPVFPGVKEDESPTPTPTPTPPRDPCADECMPGTSATSARMHASH